MALINASDYGSLASVSANAVVQKKIVKFFNVFISSDRRGKMNGGYYHCPASMENENEKFFILNQDCVYFIPLYLKKYWTKTVQVKNQKGEMIPDVVDFGWEDNVPKVEGAKYEYIVAGYLYDFEKKAIVKHTEDMKENEISAGDPVLIYFRCKGIKCNCAFKFIDRVNEAAKNHTPLTDNPTVEKNVINPRRFLIKAAITQSDPIHNRRFNIYDFTPEMKLPDDLVVKILDASKKHLDDFNKQFDATEYIKNKQQNKQQNQNVDIGVTQDAPVTKESVMNSSNYEAPVVSSPNDLPDISFDL